MTWCEKYDTIIVTVSVSGRVWFGKMGTHMCRGTCINTEKGILLLGETMESEKQRRTT